MPARTLALLLAATALLPGCIDRVTGDLPGDWDAGDELLAHSLSRYHSGGYEARVFPETPPDTDPVPQVLPDHCVAYRGEHAYAGDACTVITEDSEHWFPVDGTDPPWGLWGKWEGRFDDTADDVDPAYPRRLVAFDEDGVVLAHWGGAVHPEASFSTE